MNDTNWFIKLIAVIAFIAMASFAYVIRPATLRDTKSAARSANLQACPRAIPSQAVTPQIPGGLN